MTTAQPQPFAIRPVASEPPLVVLAVAGELDITTAPALRSALLAHADTSVVIDLSDVSFLDSIAISVLVSVHKRHCAAGTTLRITNPQPAVARVLDLTGVGDALLDVEAMT